MNHNRRPREACPKNRVRKVSGGPVDTIKHTEGWGMAPVLRQDWLADSMLHNLCMMKRTVAQRLLIRGKARQ